MSQEPDKLAGYLSKGAITKADAKRLYPEAYDYLEKNNLIPAGAFAFGKARVPFNNYPALLHEGERVMTKQEVLQSKSNKSVVVGKLADTIIVREDADIDKIADALVNKLEATALNYGGV
jgi:hypothetical protein